MRACLFYMGDTSAIGGHATMVDHLVRALRSRGVSAMLVEPWTKDDDKPRKLKNVQTTFTRASPSRCAAIARSMPCGIITYYRGSPFKNRPAFKLEMLDFLCKLKVPVCTHAPGDLKGDELGVFKRHSTQAVSIRPALEDAFGGAGVECRFLRHPYVPSLRRPPDAPRKWNAVSMTRLAFVKWPQLIFEANRRLAGDKRVRIYGNTERRAIYLLENGTSVPGYYQEAGDEEFARQYVKGWPDWERDYHGKFNAEQAVGILSDSSFAVDASYYAKGGGGTQYTFLEAWDAGTMLLLNRRWISTGVRQDPEMVDGEVLHSFNTPSDLVALLEDDPLAHRAVAAEGQRRMLGLHSAPDVYDQWKGWLKRGS